MKKLLLLMVSMLVGMAAVQAQDAVTAIDDEVNLAVVKPAVPSKETKAQRKAHEKEMRAQVNQLAHEKALQAMEQGYFVVMADRISDGRTGYTASGLSDNANFLLCQGDAGIFQVAYLRGAPGANGLGGMTLHGSVKGVRIKENKDGAVSMSYNMVGSQMNAYVTINLYKECDRVMVDVNPTMGRGSITLYGRLVPYRNAKIKIDR
ncbi:MAG: DUF4251 domain-containing protein [Muribaculaceae bacterium]|nr:DUF4251 domain-containing protein [Muribaculaceae bacterium]